MVFENFLEAVEGPDRDLNFAIKSGSKKTLGIIGKLSQNVNAYDDEAKHTLVRQLFSLAANIDLRDKKSGQLIAAIGTYFLKASKSAESAKFIFNEWSGRLLYLDYNKKEECQAAYQWLLLLNQSDGSAPSPRELVKVFDESQPVLSEIYKKISTCFSVESVLADKSGLQPGYKLVETFLTTYFYHSDSCPSNYELWALSCVERDISFGNGLILSVLQRSYEHPQVVAGLIDLYITSMVDENDDGMAWRLFFDLFDPEEYPAQQLNQIFVYLEPKVRQWTDEQNEYAINCLFALEQDDNDSVKKLLTDSKGVGKLANLLAFNGNGRAAKQLSSLLARDLSPAYKLPTGGEAQFEDLNFKLMIIDELMYINKLLSPRFNLRDFTKAYDAREISVSGYESIPEALDYMRGLAIPQELLSRITHLSYDASREIYSQLVPFWDGEDDRFEVSSLSDLDKFENIQEIEGFNEQLVESFSPIIESKNITVIK
ncbi:hypothetical protein NJR55_13195 [Idiomarina sp. M1R2S28]|uniref:DUF6892 domain-containing protein n=1 Tax=Idiomarina rhizosphaerae TaxID=2961572 RepID=A0A9X2G3D9_9GAMM|nr:hypothetical protein [Idiomarina rhizosphaerae]MCP1340536.1 hypothetical protein [Idiomarina rhizosphaerae]